MINKEAIDENRAKRREDILQAARRLFLEKDWNEITFGHIAAETGVSRVTLYKYFNSLQDISFELQVRCLYEVNAHMNRTGQAGSSGAEKLTLMMQGLLDVFRDLKEEIRFVAMFDHYYRVSFPSEEFRLKYRAALQHGFINFRDVIREGIRDGSLRPEFDPDLLSEMFTHSVLSLLQRMAVRGHLIQKQWGIEPEQVVRYLTLFLSEFAKTAPDPHVFVHR